MIDIEIKSIPHDQHRYPTCGDYWDEGAKEVFRVSDMGDWRYEFLVVFHELIEKTLLRLKGVPIEDVDAFDIQYEKDHAGHDLDAEPGNDPAAPYYHEHQLATGLERSMAAMMGVDWQAYERRLNELP